MDIDELAMDIRNACERKGYDLVLREFSPRTEIGARNFIERSKDIAEFIIQQGASQS